MPVQTSKSEKPFLVVVHRAIVYQIIEVSPSLALHLTAYSVRDAGLRRRQVCAPALPCMASSAGDSRCLTPLSARGRHGPMLPDELVHVLDRLPNVSLEVLSGVNAHFGIRCEAHSSYEVKRFCSELGSHWGGTEVALNSGGIVHIAPSGSSTVASRPWPLWIMTFSPSMRPSI
jgi:hypothetical protein